jgi:hypothetical protein
MAIVSDIVYGGLRLCGIRYDTLTTTQLAEALTAFNEMIASWEEIHHYAPAEETLTLTAGTESYTIGSGGDLDTTRPMRIESAFIRDSDGYDHSVNVILSKREYDEIYDKDISGRPDALYYAPENTLGILYFNKAPDAAETLYISSIKPYPAYSALTDTLLEPIEYEDALRYNFAITIAPEHNVSLLNTVIEKSVILKNDIARRNSRLVPSAKVDPALRRIGRRSASFNINTGSY